MLPVAATHPPTGGIAPGIDPKSVFRVVICFSGVYINRYVRFRNDISILHGCNNLAIYWLFTV